MTKDLIRYDLLVQDALKGVVRKVLGDAARDGLLGDHHYYISFRTDFPGVRLSQRMRDKYPKEMTIVLQHQFWELGITEHAFEVGLSFSGVPERLLIPFDALTGFYDPSVQFGLKFEVQDAAAAPAEPQKIRGAGSEPAEMTPKKSTVPAVAPVAKPPATTQAPAEAEAEPAKESEAPKEEVGASVVSLDAFRKKT